MAEQVIELQPGESEKITFETTPYEAKTYQVLVDGLTGSFRAITYVAPEEFTATEEQLEELEETATPEEYDDAIDDAYDEAAAEAEDTGGVVAWSADEGYHVISEEEAWAYGP